MAMYLKIVKVGFLLCCFAISVSFAQSKKDKRKSAFDSNYVSSFRERFHLAVFLATRGSNVTLYNMANKNESVQYSPNNFLNIGLGVNYKYVMLETSFKFPFLNTTDPRKGKSSVANIRVNFIRHKYWLKGIVQNVSGFHLTNPQIIDPDWFKYNTNYPLRPDISQNLFYLTGNYVFNHSKFSYRSTINACEHQIRSAGSFVVGFTISNYGARGKNSLLPESLKGRYTKDSDILRSRISHYGVNVGYLHTFAIKKKIFINLGSIGSVGVKNTNTTFAYRPESFSETGFGFIFDNQMAIGYNGDRNFVSINLNSLTLSDNLKRQIEFDYQFLRLIYSRRM